MQLHLPSNTSYCTVTADALDCQCSYISLQTPVTAQCSKCRSLHRSYVSVFKHQNYCTVSPVHRSLAIRPDSLELTSICNLSVSFSCFLSNKPKNPSLCEVFPLFPVIYLVDLSSGGGERETGEKVCIGVCLYLKRGTFFQCHNVCFYLYESMAVC